MLRNILPFALLLMAAACAAPPPPPGLLTPAELGAPAPDLVCNEGAGGWVRPCPLSSGAAIPAPLELVRDHAAGGGGANLKLRGAAGPLRSTAGRLARWVEADGRQIGATFNGVPPVFFSHLRVGTAGVIYLRDVTGQFHYWPGHGETFYPIPAASGPVTGR